MKSVFLLKSNTDNKETFELGFNDGKYCGRITDDSLGTLSAIYNGLTHGQLIIEVNKIDTKTKKGK